MKRFLLVVLAFVGFMTIVMFVGALLLLVVGVNALGKISVPTSAVLEIDFERPFVESPPLDPIARFLQDDQIELRSLIESIDRAAEDSRVVAIRADVSGVGLGLAQIQEVRAAIERFRASGKPAVAFAETFGELSPGNASYYLATSFDRIYLQPSGDCNLVGFHLEHPFLRGTFDKLGIVPRFGQRYEYKNAANLFTETAFTDAHREASASLLGSLSSQLTSAVTQTRGVDPARLQELIDSAPLDGAETLAAGLVDGLLYRDQVEDTLRSELGDEIEGITIDDYIDRKPENPFGSKDGTVALVYGYGSVQRGSSSSDVGGEPVMGSATVGSALREALDDERVDAIVFRVSSPGGSYVASDAIWRETMRIREEGKPLVVSMGDYAASGGYFVSLAADHIVAEPATLTGSIGVFGGKLVLEGLADKLGVTFDELSTGAHASIYSPMGDYSESEWIEVNSWLDRVYADFTQKVADARGLSLAQVHEIARGRVWTGQDAFDLGLVDELGDLEMALDRAAELAGLEGEYSVQVYPEPKSTWELIMERRAFRSAALNVREWSAMLARLRPIAQLLEQPAPLEAPRISP